MRIKIISSTGGVGVGQILEVPEDTFTVGNKVPFRGGIFEIIRKDQINEDTYKIVGVNFIATIRIL